MCTNPHKYVCIFIWVYLNVWMKDQKIALKMLDLTVVNIAEMGILMKKEEFQVLF